MSSNDWWTDYQAWLVSHHYNLIPHDPLKSEHVTPTDGVASFFFANTSNSVKVHIQYNPDELVPPE